MECDVLDARPKPEIQWFTNGSRTPISEVRDQNQILYLDGGRYLFIRQMTALQRMNSYHCEVVNAYLNQTHVRAPITYLLSSNISNRALEVYRPVNELHHATSGEEVTYVYAAAQVEQDRVTASPLSLSCQDTDNLGIGIGIMNGVVLNITGLSVGIATINCTVNHQTAASSRSSVSWLVLRFLVSRKRN